MLAGFMMIQIFAANELCMNSVVLKTENNSIHLSLRKFM